MAMEMSRSTERKEENEKEKKKTKTPHNTTLHSKECFLNRCQELQLLFVSFCKGSSSVDGCVLLLPKLHPSAARQGSCSRYIASRLHLGAAAL